MGTRQEPLRLLGCRTFRTIGIRAVLLLAGAAGWCQMQLSSAGYAATLPGSGLQESAQLAQPSAPVRQGQAPENRPGGSANPMSAACGRELQQFCSGVEPGQGRLVQCLDARRSELSEGCRSYLQPARQGCTPEAGRVVRCVRPSDTDPAIKRYDRVHYVLFNQTTGPGANLLVFLPGTGWPAAGPDGSTKRVASRLPATRKISSN